MKTARRRQGGVIDAVAALLCCWAAAYHTPAGALLRSAVARAVGRSAEVRPLLAYYSGGLFDAQPVVAAPTPDGVPSLEAAAVAQVGPGDALAKGVFVSAQRTANVALPTLAAATERIASLRSQLPSEEAVVLAIFAGDSLADFAVRRTRAEGRPPTLEAFAKVLPPSSAKALSAASEALVLGTAFGLGWPVSRSTRISSPFGWRTHPTLSRPQLHTGVDLAVPSGTQVASTFAGTVRRASEDAVNGRVVIIDHGHGVTTAYCHNEALLVRVGERVAQGQTVALSGSTGRSTGPHVHYQLELAHQPVDPLRFTGPLEQVRDVPSTPPPAPRPVQPEGPSAALRSALQRSAVPPATEDLP